VQKALDNVSKERTTLVIAHKLSTVQKADNIVVMSKGVIVEQGTHEYLIANQGFYSRLVNAQDLHQRELKNEDDAVQEPSSKAEDEPMSLLRTKTTETRYGTIDPASSEKPQDSLNYSLVKCLAILIVKHKELWPHFFITLLVCIVGGKLLISMPFCLALTNDLVQD
jgi:ATP-binding cassette subfamily B (MDR/TAP) protein 1